MIGIIDYDVGNIKAFENIYKRLAIPHKRINSIEDVSADVEKYILPGVGSFDHAMLKLNQSGLLTEIEREIIDLKKPVLGICVGMQMLAHKSDEGQLPGLGWINGEVKKIDTHQLHQKTHLPHMGWNTIESSANSLFSEINSGSRFYFLHSYYFDNHEKMDSIATSNYGINFCCAVNRDNIFGVQFHPEKSHDNGIQLLKNFSEL